MIKGMRVTKRVLLQIGLKPETKARVVEAAGGPRKVSVWVESILLAALDARDGKVRQAKERVVRVRGNDKKEQPVKAESKHLHRRHKVVDVRYEKGQKIDLWECECGEPL